MLPAIFWPARGRWTSEVDVNGPGKLDDFVFLSLPSKLSYAFITFIWCRPSSVYVLEPQLHHLSNVKGCAWPGVANFRLWGTAPSCLMDDHGCWLKVAEGGWRWLKVAEGGWSRICKNLYLDSRDLCSFNVATVTFPGQTVLPQVVREIKDQACRLRGCLDWPD